MDIKLPRWLLRKIVRRNPWLLSDEGRVRRTVVLEVFGFELELYGDLSLTPEEKAFFQAETEAQPDRLV
ncbi:hypothetical protein ACN2C7_17210 [Caulobacter sp. ErkDOM-E]|uniref:hypothetical protein n=1 Tax=Caulobacter sp. ErkDOM-E TaxID=3402778 RepID=UPI003AF5988D